MGTYQFDYFGPPSFSQSFTIEDLQVADCYYVTLIPLCGGPINLSNNYCFSMNMLTSLFFPMPLTMQKS